METSPEPFQPTIERVKERLRQEREVFNQHKAHENRWFILRLVMGYSSVILLTSIMAVSSYILLHGASFSDKIVTAAGAALFVDVLGLLVSIWKVAFKPDFITKLAPITGLDESEAAFFEPPRIDTSGANKNDLIILSARYGAHDRWMDVTPLLRAKIVGGKLRVRVTNEEMGGDPFPNMGKKLELTYSHGGLTSSKTAPETGMLYLPE